MNFTHLVKAEVSTPDQKLLQNADYYLVIFTLSDEMSEYVLEEVGVDLQSTSKALCWIIQRRHLDVAPRGSVLRKICELIATNRTPENSKIEHSFVAWISKKDFIARDENKVKFFPLFLMLETDPKSKVIRLRKGVIEAMNDFESTPFIDKLKTTIPVLSLFMEMFRLGQH